jgi:hypothetical protein
LGGGDWLLESAGGASAGEVEVPLSDLRFTCGCDVYSFGMTCHELVSGCILFEDASSFDEVCELVLKGERPRALLLVAGIPPYQKLADDMTLNHPILIHKVSPNFKALHWH